VTDPAPVVRREIGDREVRSRQSLYPMEKEMRKTGIFAAVAGFASALAAPVTVEAQLPAGVTEIASVEGITE